MIVGSGIDLATSDQAGVEALVSRIIADNEHRCNPTLVRQWAYNSGEAVKWVIDRAKQGGSPVINMGNGSKRTIIRNPNQGIALKDEHSFITTSWYPDINSMLADAAAAEADYRLRYGHRFTSSS